MSAEEQLFTDIVRTMADVVAKVCKTVQSNIGAKASSFSSRGIANALRDTARGLPENSQNRNMKIAIFETFAASLDEAPKKAPALPFPRRPQS